MHLVTLCPLAGATLPWQPGAAERALTVVCKGTFELRDGRAQLCPQQEPLHEADRHYNDDQALPVYAPSDLCPFKAKVDVTLVGEAFAPQGQPARSTRVRLAIGAIDKACEVHADRHFDVHGELVDGPRFTRMGLGWERAAGGPSTINPAGVDRHAPPDRYGRRRLPNLLVPGAHVSSPADAILPIGFGPIAAVWPSRRELLSRAAAEWIARRLDGRTPADLDHAFWQAAPPDQRLDELREGERLVLDNLRPGAAQLSCQLPSARPRVFVERTAAVRELAMRADSLWIDSARGLFCLTWRGRIDLAGRDEPGRILLALDTPEEPLSLAQIQRLAAGQQEAAIADELTAASPSDRPRAPSLDGELPPMTLAVPARKTQEFQPLRGTRDLSPAWLSQTGKHAPVRDPGDRAESPPPRALVPPPPARVQVDPTEATAVREMPAAPPASILSGPLGSGATLSSAASAPGAVVLIGIDETAAARLEDHAPWQGLVPAQAPDRLCALARAVLARAKPAAGDWRELLFEGAAADEPFEPPLVLVRGSLRLEFDEIAVLKATLCAVAPFAAGHAELADAVAAANELMSTRWLGHAVAADLAANLRQICEQAERLGQGDLDADVERTLLRERSYQRREAFGGSFLRARLTPAAGRAPLPTYLPEAFSRSLPMFGALDARVIGELHPEQEEQDGAAAAALRAIALARVVSLRR